ENGRRLMVVHIDGDGFINLAEVAGSPFAGEVLYSRVLQRYRIPHTVSIIQGEIAPNGMDPKDSPRLEAIARRIFALPNLENENVYTNLWTGPFYGYERAIETFELTERPYRLKPINIYYHAYSASKRASLSALDKVYQWALSQPVMNLYASEYVQKVLDFNRI